jgi:hypothetical protein
LDGEVNEVDGKIESLEYALNQRDLVIVLHVPDEALLSAVLELGEGEGHFRVVSATPVVQLRDLQLHLPSLQPESHCEEVRLQLEVTPDLPPDFFRLTISGFGHFSQAGRMLQAIRGLPGVGHVTVEQLAHGAITTHGNYGSPIPLATRLAALRTTGAHL